MPRTGASATAKIELESQAGPKKPAKKTKTNKKEIEGRLTRSRLQNITNPKVEGTNQTVKGRRPKRMGSTADSKEGIQPEGIQSPKENVPHLKRKITEITEEIDEKVIGDDAAKIQKSEALSPESTTPMEIEEPQIAACDMNEKARPEENVAEHLNVNVVMPPNKEEMPVDAAAQSATTNGVKSSSNIVRMSLKGSTHHSTATKPTRTAEPQYLLTVLSNLYLNAIERLQLSYPPRCAEDLAHCHKHHYLALAPVLPTNTQLQNMRVALQHERYISFLDLVMNMCYRGVYPGGSILTNLVELLLSINSKCPNEAIMNRSYHKCIEVFSLVLITFPPCWWGMRHFYIDFFQGSLDTKKLSQKDVYKLTKSDKIFNILLDLLEDALKNYSTTLSKTPTDPTDSSQPEDLTPQTILSEMTVCSEYFNQWEWEKRENRLQTFEALDLESRLERLFVVLRILLQILENNFVMWILYHHKKAKDWIFRVENRPLVVQVFDLSMHLRCTEIVTHLFNLFATAVSMDLPHERLQILERYIALLLVTSNTADIEKTVIGVKYPYLGANTKQLIWEFFKIFKAKNTSKTSSYINTIELLRVPFVRYEFIDLFLRLFYFPHSEAMSPKKIAYDMAKKRWLKYRSSDDLQVNVEENISREQYLALLLKALEAYCAWHGLQTFFQLITHNKHIENFRAVTDSVHRTPTHGKASGVLMLKKISNDIEQLTQQLKMTVRMSRPKVDLPIADICIDGEIITKYRNDLKYVVILHDMIPKLATAYADIDFSKWQEFLNEFKPIARGNK